MTNNQLDSTVARILAHLWRGGSFGYLWTASEATKPKPNPEVKGEAKEQRTFWCAANETPLLPSDRGRHGVRHIYFAVHPTTARGTEYQRAKSGERDTAAVNALFSEFDLAQFDGDPAALRAHVDALTPAPSIYWNSGKGGIQVLWLLDEPLLLDTSEQQIRADWVQKAWVERTGGDDGAKDLKRVLRVPGTKNYKAKYGPDFPTVQILKADFEQLYSFEELAALVPPVPEAKVKASRRRADSTEVPAPEADDTGSLDKIAEITSLLQRLNPERADKYTPWLNVGMICKDELGTAGLYVWKAWAQQSSTYEPGCCEQKWPTFNSNVGGERVTIGSLRHWANEDDPPVEATPDDPQTVAELCRQVDNLYQQVEKLEQWREWALAVAALPTEKLSPAAKVVAVSLWPEMQSRQERDLTAPTPLWIEDKAKAAGLSPGTYGKRLKELANVGAIVREEAHDPVTGNAKTLIAPAAWQDSSNWAPQETRNHGGQRPNAGRPALPQCDCGTCTPDTPIIEAAVLSVEYVSDCGKPLATHQRSRRERIWQPDPEGHWSPSPWKQANPQHAAVEKDVEPSPSMQVECWPVPPIIEETFDRVAVLRCADGFAPPEELGRRAYKTALNWWGKGQSEQAADLLKEIREPQARAIIEHLVARPSAQVVTA